MSTIILESLLTAASGIAVVFTVLIVLWIAIVIVSKLVGSMTGESKEGLWTGMKKGDKV